MKPRIALCFGILSLVIRSAALGEAVRLAHEPALSPDGKTVAFGWCGDIWTVPIEGGKATRLTANPALDSGAAFSPDGNQIAFNSDRDGSKQIYAMPIVGGEPRQLTWNTDGYDLREWLPDGKGVLACVARDYSWMRDTRASHLAIVNVNERRAEQLLFEAYGTEGAVSANGKRVLFMREGSEAWWRQGYKGSRAGQIWLFDREDGSFTQVIAEQTESRWPLWRPDGKGLYFVSNRDGTFNLWEHGFGKKGDKQLTHFKGDSVVFPAISRDGSTVVFRVRFDLYRWHPGDPEPVQIEIDAATEPAPAIERVVLEKAASVRFTPDGLQMALVSGGDVWVMDTELKEPKQVTHTAEEERGAEFSPDGKSLLFVSDAEGQTDIWKATREDETKDWWENADFSVTRLTNDADSEFRIRFTSDGKHIGYVKGSGLWMANPDGSNAKRLVQSWDPPDYEFSPDGLWVVYSVSDEWFNEDVWLMPVDQSKPAFNLSRHPNSDGHPVWSPDGRKIAWTGKREIDEVDIFYVNLREEDEEQTRRDRTIEKAREKFKVAAKLASTTARVASGSIGKPGSHSDMQRGNTQESKAGDNKTAPRAAKPAALSAIDFDDIHERIHRISIANSVENTLVWSPDSKKLAFHANVEGRKGTFEVEIPDDLKPKEVAAFILSGAQWLRREDQIVGLRDGVPASVPAKPSVPRSDLPRPETGKTYAFRARQSYERTGRQRAVFQQCWQMMRDRYYDERHGNKNWDAIRKKYEEAAAEAPDMRGVTECVWLMLGELNGSHLGFTLEAKTNLERTWHDETAHLGLRFDPKFPGPGWKVRDVLPRGPASRKESRIEVGEVILKVDGQEVKLDTDVSEVLNGLPERDIELEVKSVGGAEREVTLRPINYLVARKLLYDEWLKNNRRTVEARSNNALGYLHINAMNDESFQKFQEELYHAGAGKDGLILDVRENGGGSTTDHLLTALTQPQHAITVPRGGRPGYPQDRIVYATWSKPVVVLCNQDSYSNAEIFSHAIQTLKRGRLVGVPTAGGVLSTGAVDILDVGKLRIPFRGWYGIEDGKDFELNGAVPDFLVWPKPGESAKGIDAQLDKAVEVLMQEVAAWKKRPKPKLIKASDRG